MLLGLKELVLLRSALPKKKSLKLLRLIAVAFHGNNEQLMISI